MFVYKSISFENCKIVSPATFVNKLDKLLALLNVCRTSATFTQSIKTCFNEKLELHGIHSGRSPLFNK